MVEGLVFADVTMSLDGSSPGRTTASSSRSARAATDGKDVGIGGAQAIRQYLKAGLLDELHIHVVPVLVGDGVRLFERLGIEPIELEPTSVVEGRRVTHLGFRVPKETSTVFAKTKT